MARRLWTIERPTAIVSSAITSRTRGLSTAHCSSVRPDGSTVGGHGTSTPARRNWHSAPQQGKQASRLLAAGKGFDNLPATSGPSAHCGTTPHSDQIDTVTYGFSHLNPLSTGSKLAV